MNIQQPLLKKKINFKEQNKINSLISHLGLHTICVEAMCPNISECFSKGHATFLILGDICTRGCRFCNLKKGRPRRPDPGEPSKVKEAVERLKLKHVVITSPTRDDLIDGGADIFYQTICRIKQLSFVRSIEVLIPDFKANLESIKKVVGAKPEIIGHNLETVARFYQVRRGADYQRSLNLLKKVKEMNSEIKTKSALILGLGEEKEEVIKAIKDLRGAGCDFLALGQYLAPRKSSYPVKRIVKDQEFSYYKKKAYSLGFLHVEAGTYVRSSYHADKYLSIK
ncbi:MAG: lipoyl synthase [Candidatus Omnitrophica bacterium]|nr:lipoyl synthase [Candidatus Omnitrophota bacterium]MCF7876776.1 lipoyl synthase [Candidatus Omnitrophota bacterium]MCF7878222.1 lipoyl synthase [Candidatus Omnitrophota bacterium]